MTINDAIKAVMKLKATPLTAEEAYSSILEHGLYEFHADNPLHVVRSQIRRHCVGLEFPTASKRKHFRLIGANRYVPLDSTEVDVSRVLTRRKSKNSKKVKVEESPLGQIQALHKKYIQDLKTRILGKLKKISPSEFELFAKRLLDIYGFHDTHVTQVSGDGGIDGYGKLKVGLADLNVAFQCKRYTKGNVQRPEIDKFRGASQGDYEQGLFFTTSSFSEGSIGASIKRGAVPIILVDGNAIVDLMIEKSFGVQMETLEIPSDALDLVLVAEETEN